MADKKDFTFRKGETFQFVLRWETMPYVYKAVSAITQAAPARITATGHGLRSGWRAAVVSAKGMTQINAQNDPPKASEYRPVTVVDANTVEFNDINSANFKAYTSGGYLMYKTPSSLAGFAARMSIKDKVGGTELLRFQTTPGPTHGSIVLDDTEHTITLSLSATISSGLTFSKGVYDLELESGTGVVTALLSGSVLVTTEVTTA